MGDDSNYFLTTVGRLIERRTKKTKLFWKSGFFSGKRLKRASSSTGNVCDGETQTTPSIEKTFYGQTVTGSMDVLQLPVESCVVDSSRDSLGSDSDTYMDSCESYENPDEARFDDGKCFLKTGNCPCAEMVEGGSLCLCRLHENAILNKLADLQQEVNSLRTTLCSLKLGGRNELGPIAEHGSTSPTPPPPPPPPPFPSSPVFPHTVSLSCLTQRSKRQPDEAPAAQERAKPIVTLEDLQRVKLRQVSSVANVNLN